MIFHQQIAGISDNKQIQQTNPSFKISDQFFAWVCGFGKNEKIIGHEDVVEEFKHNIYGFREIY